MVYSVHRPLRLEGRWRGSTSSITFLGTNIFFYIITKYFVCYDIFRLMFSSFIVMFITMCRENDFEDGNHYYRFLEHEPFIPKCYNFRGCTNDSEPKAAIFLGQELRKIMSAILEAYASDDRYHVDYLGISRSEEFRRYY